MNRKFSGLLDTYLRQAGLPLRRVARQAGIPHQTIYNWAKGVQPRWHAALPEDLQRLGTALGLGADEIALLLQVAGCSPARSAWLDGQEVPMESSLRMPKGWFASGDAPGRYEMGVDPTLTYKSRACITIKAGPDPTEFAVLAQELKAEAYRGKRVRFSAAIRGAEIENRAALFMRISAEDGKLLAFDNMRSRYISGTTDWGTHAVVLDVAEEAESIIFGILLSLKGQVWMADVHLEGVGPEVPTTDLLAEIAPYFPVNLDFAE
jgi:hypothetical protein